MSKSYRASKPSNNKGRTSRPDSRQSARDRELRSKTNDPSWYGHNEALVRDSASIPWSYAVGTPIDLKTPIMQSDSKDAMPGLCSMKIMPTFGKSVNPDSPLNVAATAVYAYIRHANSGHANYDSPDLMLYLMSMSQVYSAIVWLQRTYGIATLYSQKNRYLPDVLLDASGFNAANVQTNLANFRYRINELISKAASLAVPSGMTIFNRHAFLFQNVYCEGDSIKDQLYMYNPAGFYKFTLNNDSSGKLEYKTVEYGMTFDTACNYVSDMLQRLLMSEDMNIMSGDILKAYGSNGIIKLNMIPTDYSIVPVYDFNVLNQMKNATVIGPHIDRDIAQDDSHAYLIANPKLLTGADVSTNLTSSIAASKMMVSSERRLLTTTVTEPTPSDTIEATRLMVGVEKYTTTGADQRVAELIFGSEIVADTYYYTLSTNVRTGVITTKVQAIQYAHPINFEDSDAAVVALRVLNTVSKFKFHPCHHVYSVKLIEGTPNYADCGLAFDVDNYTIIDADTLAGMHAAALINQFSVPSIAIQK